MWLARIVLAVLPIVAPTAMAGPEFDQTVLSLKIDQIPMTWRVDRETDAESEIGRAHV